MLSSNRNIAACSPRSAAAIAYCVASADLPAPAGPMITVLVPRSSPPPSICVERWKSARHLLLLDERAMLRRDEPRIDDDAAGADVEVVIAVAEIEAAHFDQLQAAPRRAVERRVPLQLDHSVRHALQLQVVHVRRSVVEAEDGGIASCEELLEREDLLAIAKAALRQKADLAERVEDDALRLDAVDLHQHSFDGFAQLDLGRIEDGCLLFLQRVFADQLFVDVDSLERPAVGLRHRAQFLGRFREGDVESPSRPPSHPRMRNCSAEGGLADAGIALQEIDAVARQPTAENVIEPVDSGRCHFGFLGNLVCLRHSPFQLRTRCQLLGLEDRQSCLSGQAGSPVLHTFHEIHNRGRRRVGLIAMGRMPASGQEKGLHRTSHLRRDRLDL